jgi:hypothetical protein
MEYTTCDTSFDIKQSLVAPRCGHVPEDGYVYITYIVGTETTLSLPDTPVVTKIYCTGAQIFHKYRSHLKILGHRDVVPGICAPLAVSIVTISVYITSKLCSNTGGLQVILF